MSAPEHVITAAAQLQRAQEERSGCAPVRELIGADDLDAAYAVQQEIVRARVASGAVRVGRKIGLTSRVVQEQFGVRTPDFGVIFDDMVHAESATVSLDDFIQPRIEGEIAFVLREDLPSAHTTVVDVLRATDFVLPAIEIVDSRIRDWDIRIADTVADNASGAAIVLGTTPHDLRGLDLTAAAMTIEHGGEPVSTGAGAACLGSPAAAVTWLAREVARRGEPLRKGEIVMSGALGPMVSVTGPGLYRLRLSALGNVDITFAGKDTSS